MPQNPTGQRNKRMLNKLLRGGMITLIVILLVAIIGYVAAFLFPDLNISRLIFTPTPTASVKNGHTSLVVISAPDGEPIGLSDGAYIFDAKRGAEVLIYQENQRILNTHRHYMTVVVGTILTGTFADSGRDSLQGAYVAQKEYNDQCLSSCLPVRLLIANSGSGDTASEQLAYASLVTEQIVKAQRADKTIVGVMGWPASSDLFYGNATLSAAHIPVVSPTALLNQPTVLPYIFSVAPSNTQQGIVGAYYAEHFLHAQRVAVFVDPVDRYSESLADAFMQRFTADKNMITTTKFYNVGSPESVQAGLPDVLNHNPDLIYFAGHANDIPLLLKDLPACNSSTCIQVLGGDALYELGSYPTDLKNFLFRLHFTAFAYPDEWGILAGSAVTPDFFSEYPKAFNPKGDHPAGAYGFTRADNNVILSYDAMTTLLRTATTTFNDQEVAFSPEDLQKALTTQNRQGISGKISFAPDGNPIDKSIVVLSFDNTGRIHQNQCFGMFLKPELQNLTSSTCASIS